MVLQNYWGESYFAASYWAGSYWGVNFAHAPVVVPASRRVFLPEKRVMPKAVIRYLVEYLQLKLSEA